jgi:hypothetical protein
MRLALKLALGAGVLLVVIQVVRFERTNPPVTADLYAKPEVKSVLRRACYDCHSNETAWPWYSAVAPVSWLLHYDVTAGRDALNFSDWGTLAPEEQRKKMRETSESVAEGEMPPWYFLPMHHEARLSDVDKGIIEAWAGPSTGEQ